MKKGTFLILFSLFLGGMFAQEPVGLLPDGVIAVIDNTRRTTQEKNLVVVGTKEVGYKAFFAAKNDEFGEELWVTDGTPEGTKMVKDINPGPGSSNVNWMARFNDKVVFAADDGTHGMEAWISDGTEDGTYMIKDIHEISDANPRGFTQVNENQFIFGAMNFESQTMFEGRPMHWLYVSDGTEEGTELIYECEVRWRGQENTSWFSAWLRVGRKVFFKARDLENNYGEELWITDGTTEGTYMVKDINTEPNPNDPTKTMGSAVDAMTNYYNQKLIFKAFSIEANNEPWVSDGTEAGTFMIKDTDPRFNDTGFPLGGGWSDCGERPYKGRVYGRGKYPEVGCELGATNGELDNFQVWDIAVNEPTADNQSFPDPGVVFDGFYIFCANWGTVAELPNNWGGEMSYTDGENVYLQYDFNPGRGSHWIKELTVVAGSAYWWNEANNPPEYRQKLMRLDYVLERPDNGHIPVRVSDFDAAGDRVHTIRNLNGTVLFCRRFGDENNNFLYSYFYRKPGYSDELHYDNLDLAITFEPFTDDDYYGVGINTKKMQPKPSLVIYPNPTSTNFQFSINDKVIDMKIFDMSGRLVQTETDFRNNTVNVNSLKTGIYNVMVTGTKGNYVTKLVIK